MNDTAGANIEEARGEINVMLESNDIKSHFLVSGKLRGMDSSVWDSHPTIPLSKSDKSKGSGASRGFLLLGVRLVAILDSLLFELDLEVTLWISFSSFREPALIDATA
jgi:hypothetical protein